MYRDRMRLVDQLLRNRNRNRLAWRERDAGALQLRYRNGLCHLVCRSAKGAPARFFQRDQDAVGKDDRLTLQLYLRVTDEETPAAFGGSVRLIASAFNGAGFEDLEYVAGAG